ncbi:MAG: Smr/MutS family protein [Pseudomonadota bacterium]
MSRGRRRRSLTADDHAAWHAVARTTSRGAPDPPPRKTQGAPVAEPAASPQDSARQHPSPPRPIAAKASAAAPPHGFFQGRSPSSATSVRASDAQPRPVGRPEAGLDRRTAERLRRGSRDPDARIDLHGMTAERAHAALDRFIADASRHGHRCVLVITGKGGRRAPKDAPWLEPGRGVLRDAVPRWLRSGPHARRIVGLFEAHHRHGGSGALYVYLKKPR